jgi:serine protease Do
MFRRLTCSILASAALFGVRAETLELRDQASVTGKILVNRKDQVVVDLGFTVLVVPRAQIIRILRGESDKPAASAPPSVAGSRDNLYFTAATPPPEKNVRELVAQLGESVVQVKTPGGLGSGFILNEDGYLLTNFHVTEGETQISVEVYHQAKGQLERKTYRKVRVIALNKFGDLALLKIEDADAPKFSKVLIGSSDKLEVGDPVFAIGSPMGFERSVTEGILSAKGREFQGALYLQTTTQINPGNSGGPLFNLRGEVVGITNMKITFSEGLGFAIPIEQARTFLDHRDSYAYDNDNPSNPFRYLDPPGRTSAKENADQH